MHYHLERQVWGVQGAAIWVKVRWLWDVQGGRLTRDIREEAFNPHWEMWVCLASAGGGSWGHGFGVRPQQGDSWHCQDVGSFGARG